MISPRRETPYIFGKGLHAARHETIATGLGFVHRAAARRRAEKSAFNIGKAPRVGMLVFWEVAAGAEISWPSSTRTHAAIFITGRGAGTIKAPRF